MYYTAIPPELEEDTDEPDFPREFRFGLVEYALFDCHAQQRETKKALEYWKSYLGYQQRLADFVNGRTSIDREQRL